MNQLPLNRQVIGLASLTLFNFLLISTRVIITAQPTYVFLLWNLFLAWTSLGLLYCLHKTHNKAIKTGLSIVWITFLPNSFYLITDLFHLHKSPFAPLWLDTCILFTASLIGIWLGLISIRIFENTILKRLQAYQRTLVILFIFTLNAFGVYLGRYLRWNSWELLTNPIKIIEGLKNVAISPAPDLFWFTLSYAILFGLTYTGLYKNTTLSPNSISS